jgi:hypothetical protein
LFATMLRQLAIALFVGHQLPLASRMSNDMKGKRSSRIRIGPMRTFQCLAANRLRLLGICRVSGRRMVAS